MDTETVENVENTDTFVENSDTFVETPTVVEEPPRRRGRPKGSKNKKTRTKSSDVFVREEDLPDPEKLPFGYVVRVLKMFNASNHTENDNQE